jgi:hypothetical protein
MRPPAGAISLAQAARLSGYHQDYLGQLCRAGKLSATKLGRTWFTTETAVRDFLRSLQGPSAQQDGTFDQPVFEEAPQDEVAAVQPQSSVGPQIVENVVISEVVGMPIALTPKPALPRTASLDGVIMRVKLEQVQRDLANLTDAVQELAGQVEQQGDQLQSLQFGSGAMKHTYIPSLEFAQNRHVEVLPSKYISVEPEVDFPLRKRILVVSGSMLAIALLFMFSISTDWQQKFFGQPTVATQTINYESVPQVAGENVIVPIEISLPSTSVSNTNTPQSLPQTTTTPGTALGGLEAGDLLQ